MTLGDGTPLGLGFRLQRAGRTLAYLLLSLPLGVLSVFALVAVAIGAAIGFFGTPLLVGAVAFCRRLADQDRRAANVWLGAHIPPLPGPPRDRRARQRRPLDVLSDRQLDVLSDRPLIRMLVLLALKLPAAAILLALTAAIVAVAGGLVVLGVKGIGGIGPATYVGPIQTGVLSGIGLTLLALPVTVLAIAGLGAAGGMLRTLSRSLLIAPAPAAGGPVREMLAESLGDRTLSIAYWLADREIFVDEAGRAVTLPATGSGRAWTAVERDGRRVAAILHDAELDTSPELVHAAAAAAALAIDNERLKADLRARVEELRVSRVRIVQAGDAARRQIERDLHDGAQQQLVGLALDLRMLKTRLKDPGERAAVDDLAEKLGAALHELRELARGIHPVVLTAQGLGPAVESLAHRTSVPVECVVDVGAERLSPPIEAAAYFLVAEALTNVVRYAGATSALVEIRRDGDDVVVEVLDDGVGGADMTAGTGLRGLADRISALEGTLRVDSPRGGGTRVQAWIPCGAGALVSGALEPEASAPADPPPAAVLEAPR